MGSTNTASNDSRPIDALSIDCLVFGFRESRLELLLVEHGEGIISGQWALPGGWVRYNEDIDAAANRLLMQLTGLRDVYLEQLRAFGSADRYPTKRVITIAFFALVRPEEYQLDPGFTASDVRWYTVNALPFLPYDHGAILSFGLDMLRKRIRYEPIGFNLLPRKFTLLQLQRLYEAILGMKLDKPNFRRKIMKMKLLIPCKEKQTEVSHRAARLFRFDEKIYKELQRKGFIFEY